MKPYAFFDAHCDTISCCTRFGWNLSNSPGQVDFSRGREMRHYAQVFAMFRDAAEAPIDGMFAECCRQNDMFRAQLSLNADAARHCCTKVELEDTRKDGKCAAFLSIEGADLLECDPGRLDLAAQWGVRSINLTWNRANALSGSHMQEIERGLGQQGRDFVHRAQALGIRVDVSHLSDPGFWDLMDITDAPVIASHSDSCAVCAHSRNLTDEMFRAVKDTGGFVGINFYTPFVGGKNRVEDLFAHIEHFLALGGEDTLGFGGDWDGCEQMPEGIVGIESMDLIWEEMEKRNYSKALMEKLFYQNLARVIVQE